MYVLGFLGFGLSWRGRGLIERLRTSGARVHSLLREEGRLVSALTVDCMRVDRPGPSGCGFGFGVLISLSFAVIIPGPLDVREAERLIGKCFYPNSICSVYSYLRQS